MANGRAFTEAVLADPSRMPRQLEFESLLSLDYEAFALKTGEEYDRDTRLSFESSSNLEGWRSDGGSDSDIFTSASVPPGNRRPT